MVSHNEHVISGSMDELWVVSQGKVAPFHGNFQDHKKMLQSSLNQASLVLLIIQEWFNGVMDVDGSVPFFREVITEGNLVLSDDAEVVKKGCGKSFAPFSKGSLSPSPSPASSARHFRRLISVRKHAETSREREGGGDGEEFEDPQKLDWIGGLTENDPDWEFAVQHSSPVDGPDVVDAAALRFFRSFELASRA
ncbi:hypothetical protein NL676_029478 [Syzygium grande]|nr:hypothetical protein NL676_029478 [Syzygium grande]